MANWKKLVVSGSDAYLNSLYVSNNITVSGELVGTASYALNSAGAGSDPALSGIYYGSGVVGSGSGQTVVSASVKNSLQIIAKTDSSSYYIATFSVTKSGSFTIGAGAGVGGFYNTKARHDGSSFYYTSTNNDVLHLSDTDNTVYVNAAGTVTSLTVYLPLKGDGERFIKVMNISPSASVYLKGASGSGQDFSNWKYSGEEINLPPSPTWTFVELHGPKDLEGSWVVWNYKIS